MYETKLRKHEREYPHPKESEIREIVRWEITRALANFGWSLVIRFFYSLVAAGMVFLSVLLVASMIMKEPSQETSQTVLGIARALGGIAFFLLAVFYRWNE